MIRTLTALLLLSSAASAQDSTIYVQPREVSEEAKILALKLGYMLNGDSMVRWGSIDLPAELAKAKAAPAPEPVPDPEPAKPRKRR